MTSGVWRSACVSLQDVERKEIARELHDEFGPYPVFALRAHASALTRIADASEPNSWTVKKHGGAIRGAINACSSSIGGCSRNYGPGLNDP